MPKKYMHSGKQGFTLIELSIVLVVIGLIAGGIMVGRDMIHAAEIRSQVSQIEKYKTAINTFRLKYNSLPGDMPPNQATAFGMFARGGTTGDGDDNGFISETGDPGTIASGGFVTMDGENHFVWTDLSFANLIDGSFIDSTDAPIVASNHAQVSAEIPQMKLGGQDAYVLINAALAKNYFWLLKIDSIVAGIIQSPTGGAPAAPLTPLEALSIDNKIDDGLPASGSVQSIQVWPGVGYGIFGGSGGAAAAGICVPNNSGVLPFPYNTSNPEWAEIQSCGLTVEIK